jgi:hypothetical protein
LPFWELLANLRVAYLASRIYGGYADGRLNPEPYAYEGEFVVRLLILSQIAAGNSVVVVGDPGLRRARLKLAILARGYQLPLLRSCRMIVTYQWLVPTKTRHSREYVGKHALVSWTLPKG